jgi:putative transposase
MVLDPGDYPWSSYRMRVDDQLGGGWLDADPCFAELGDTPARRRSRYIEFMQQAVSDSEINLIRAALQRGQLTGTGRFIDEVERILGQRVELRGQGRPRPKTEK